MASCRLLFPRRPGIVGDSMTDVLEKVLVDKVCKVSECLFEFCSFLFEKMEGNFVFRGVESG